MHKLSFVGLYFIMKYKDRQAEAGTYKVALQMRKQGIPLWLAVDILATSK